MTNATTNKPHRFSEFAVIRTKLEGERIQNMSEILNQE